MSAASASLKIGYTPLKIRNLPSFHFGFKQTDFLRSVPPIFLRLVLQIQRFKVFLVTDKNFSAFLIFFRHFDDCLSVTMPALFPLSARQSARNKSQNHSKSIYRTNLTLTSQGGNQGMLTSCRELKVRFQR